jgi:tetraacyldisaccharide 4'-kinase
MELRSKAYAAGLFRSWRPSVPCISVGNISWGGSGKTPLAEWILQQILSWNKRPALLTRGYKARPPKKPYLVQPQSPAHEAGDEPLMLARSCPGSLVAVDDRRSRSGSWLEVEKQPDAFVLDDGLQHLRVHRDLDLVLLRPEDLQEEWNRIIPEGSWREPASALGRATAFVLHVEPRDIEAVKAGAKDRLIPFGRPVFSYHLMIEACYRLQSPKIALQEPADYLLVSGVGSPHRVEHSVSAFMGRRPKEHLAYPDHHRYEAGDWKRIKSTAARFGCSLILCTPKDGVKLEPWADGSLYEAKARPVFGPAIHGEEPLDGWLRRQLAALLQQQAG